MSGMNPGFAAYLAAKKAAKVAAPKPTATSPALSLPLQTGSMGMMMGGKVHVQHVPQGKRHSKISIKKKGK